MTTSVTTMHIFIEKNKQTQKQCLKAIEMHFKGHMINRILYSRSIHSKFINSPKARFKKSYGIITDVRSSISAG